MKRLVFASLLFSALLVGSGGADTLPAAVLGTVAAWLTMRALDARTAAGDGADPAPA